MSFGGRLRELRRKVGMTQQQVADSLHIIRATYAYYESGKTFPDLEILMRIARFYGVSTEYLLNDYRPLAYEPIVLDETTASYAVSEDDLHKENWELKESEQMLLAAFRRLSDKEQVRILTDIMDALKKGQESASKPE